MEWAECSMEKIVERKISLPNSAFWKNKKVLLTGHSGFKGAWMSLVLKLFGSDICGISLRPNTEPNLFSLCKIESKLENNFCDIRNYDKTSKIIQNFQPEIVIHMAALPLVRESYSKPIETFETNINGTINLAQELSKQKKKTIFIIEASSYQLEYSQLFKSKYAAILNLSPDHLERHKTFKNYVKAKFKLLVNQSNSDFFFVRKDNGYIQKKIMSLKAKSKIIEFDAKKVKNFLIKISNDYFLNETNVENLSFVLEITSKLKIKKEILKKTVQNLKVVKVITEKNLIVLKGCVPGHKNSYLAIKK